MRRILGFIYQSANNALYGAAWLYTRKFQQKGYAAEIFDLARPDAYAELDRLLTRDEVAFCFAPQGVGSRLGNDEQSIWKKRRIPFVGLHGDNPCYNIFNHVSDTTYVANLYVYESFADIRRRYVSNDQIVDIVPFQTDPHAASPVRFRDRPIRLLYMKSGASTGECERELNALPHPLRDGVWQQLERACCDPNLSICDLVQEIFDRLNMDRVGNFDLFWGCAHWMDMYLRRKRAIDFVEWLKMQQGAVIIGDGWDFIDKSKARAVFRPSVDIREIEEINTQTQFLCNTSPYGRDIIHERAVFGMLNESIVINDTNEWWDSNFGAIPALKRFDWGLPLDDQLQPVLQMPVEQAEEESRTGRQPSVEQFTEQDPVEKILTCVGRIDPECLP